MSTSVSASRPQQTAVSELVWIGLLAAIPSLIAWAIFGVIQTPDSPGYIEFAQQIRTGAVPSGQALLQSGPGPISLYRIGGFPALLAGLQLLFSKHWGGTLVGLQIIAQSLLAMAAFPTAMKLGARKNLAIAVSLLPAIGFAVVVNLCVLTDALYDAAVTGAVFALILRPNWRGALFAGLCLALGTSFREATIFWVLCYLPLALRTHRRWLCALLVVLPAWGLAGAQIGWNVSRGAGPVLTTSAQLVMVQAVLPLLRQHLPVYDSGDQFDQIANQTVGVGGYARINEFETRIFNEAHLTAPQIAATASRKYVRTWERFPLQMLSATISNFNPVFLEMPFQPIDTAAALMVYSNWPRPSFYRLNILWQQLRHGDFNALLWIVLNVICKTIGDVIFLAGFILPWVSWRQRRAAWDLRAIWCIPVGLTLLYLPVHLETRYMTPAIPVLCILAAVSWSRADAFRKTPR